MVRIPLVVFIEDVLGHGQRDALIGHFLMLSLKNYMINS